jgi:hypothetical protein
MRNNITYDVITKENLKKLNKFKLIVLPNVLMMTREEATAIKKYVKNGGNILSTKYTSLLPSDGSPRENFLLSEVFGVSFEGLTDENYTYIAFNKVAGELFSKLNDEYPLSIEGNQILVHADPDAQILAKLTLPYTNPRDLRKFASIHSNPPGISTNFPAVIRNFFGKGTSLYTTSDLELQLAAEEVFEKMIKMSLPNPLTLVSDAPNPVEITIYHQADKKRYIIDLLNFQKQLPNLTVFDVNLRFNTSGQQITKILSVPSNKEIGFKLTGDYVTFIVPKIDTFEMLAVHY